MKLIIADDQDLIRDAIVALIKQYQQDAEIYSVPDFFECMLQMENCKRENKDINIVVLDINMPGMNGLQGVKKFIKSYPNIPVVLMSGLVNKMEIDAAFKIGIKGFIPKTMAGKSLVNALQLVVNGEKYVHSSIYNDKSQTADNGITNREQEVLQQLFLGSSNKEIANSLNISEPTVKQHLRSLNEKLEARNRTDLIVKAIKNGHGEI